MRSWQIQQLQELSTCVGTDGCHHSTRGCDHCSRAGKETAQTDGRDAVHRNAKRAHELAEMAVKPIQNAIKALFELATDYVAGEIRTGEPSTPSPSEALKMYKDGLGYAQSKGDNEYITLFNTRIEQVSQLMQ